MWDFSFCQPPFCFSQSLCLHTSVKIFSPTPLNYFFNILKVLLSCISASAPFNSVWGIIWDSWRHWWWTNLTLPVGYPVAAPKNCPAFGHIDSISSCLKTYLWILSTGSNSVSSVYIFCTSTSEMLQILWGANRSTGEPRCRNNNRQELIYKNSSIPAIFKSSKVLYI